MIFFPDSNSSIASTPLLQRIKISASENGPQLREAAENTGRDVIDWTRRGSYLRALFVFSAVSVTLLTLTGFLVFVLFFLAATFNAVVISLLMSLAAVGGFLAIFFACVTAIYVGALSVAVIAISTATVSAVVAVVIATGRTMDIMIMNLIMVYMTQKVWSRFQAFIYTLSSKLWMWQ